MLKSAQPTTRELLEEILAERIMIIDGSMGALIYALEPSEEQYRGSRFADHPFQLKNCTEILVLTQPKMIEDIHRAYLEAGADIIETDTFNANRLSLEEFGLEDHVRELNFAAVEIARRAADDYTRRTPDKPRFVAGSIGPTKKQLSMGIGDRGPGQRDVTYRRDGRQLQGTDRRAGRGRGRHPPARDRLRHAGHEGLPVRASTSISRRPGTACR